MNSKTKALHKHKEEMRYTPARLPKDVGSQAEAKEFYKHNKGKMVSAKVNPKTGKYFNTY